MPRWALPNHCDSEAICYNRTAAKCRKYQPRPDRFGAPAWYDAEAFAGLVIATADLSPPPALGKFLRSFDGLTSTARAKAVTDSPPLSDLTSLADLAERENLIATALQVMQAQAPPVPTSKLGPIGPAHLLAVLDQRYHVDGAHWYKKRDVTIGGVPWVVEVMIAETAAPATIHHLVNHTPVLSDPFSKVSLAAGQIWGQGLAGLVNDAYVVPDQTTQGEAVVVSVVCPAPRFTDRGKTTMIVPAAVADAAAGAVWSTAKAIYRAQKAAERDERRAARQRQATTPTPVTSKTRCATPSPRPTRWPPVATCRCRAGTCTTPSARSSWASPPRSLATSTGATCSPTTPRHTLVRCRCCATTRVGCWSNPTPPPPSRWVPARSPATPRRTGSTTRSSTSRRRACGRPSTPCNWLSGTTWRSATARGSRRRRPGRCSAGSSRTATTSCSSCTTPTWRAT